MPRQVQLSGFRGVLRSGKTSANPRTNRERRSFRQEKLTPGGHMSRWSLLVLTLTMACASLPDPVPVFGDIDDVSALIGEWSGEYEGTSTGRTGSIVFDLRGATDTARGDVVMIPRASGTMPTAQGDGGPLEARGSQVISISALRVARGEVSGTLAPYNDPDCRCTVRTTFTGRLHGDTIDGTFVTQGAGTEQSGRWSVTKR